MTIVPGAHLDLRECTHLEQHIGDCEILVDFKDRDEKEVIKFGTDPSAEKIEEESEDWSAWSFSFKGQLMVIVVFRIKLAATYHKLSATCN
jgi:hypothetical protein